TPRRSTRSVRWASLSLSESRYFSEKTYSIVSASRVGARLALRTMRRAIVHHAHQSARMVARTPGRAPDAGHTELAATTVVIVVGTVDSSPCMRATDVDPPSSRFGMAQGRLDFLLWMRRPSHR